MKSICYPANHMHKLHASYGPIGPMTVCSSLCLHFVYEFLPPHGISVLNPEYTIASVSVWICQV